MLTRLDSSRTGLAAAEAARRLRTLGPNAVRSHGARAFPVLGRQLRSPLLILLAVTACASFFVGERSDAVSIGVILLASVGLGFVNEYRAEKAAEALHSSIRHRCVVVRGGQPRSADVTELVPGDVIDLQLGEVVPADIRLLATAGLECEESVLTGESVPAEKSAEAVAAGTPLAELSCCALGEHQPETEFQVGLRQFSLLLVQVAGVLTAAIFVINVLLHRPVLDALLFSLAIAVGISPQLLPAVVSTSLAAGSRQLARRKVLVKRLVCIEDLGDIDVLFTDKTGTLTEGSLRFMRSTGHDGRPDDEPLLLGLLCNEAVVTGDRAVGGNPLDVALWDSGTVRRGRLPPCAPPWTPSSRPATAWSPSPPGPAPAQSVITAAGEHDLQLRGLLVFLDPPKATARRALDRLCRLGITVKVLTGDNPAVAAKVCADLGLPAGRVATGADIDAAGDQLGALLAQTTVFARVSPEHKARIVREQRRTGVDVAFLGDGVNDAIALHAADVGISVESATDVAKDAADVLLLEKDLDVLADGVMEGRRIFANTMKYVLMGTSSNFGNMFSAAGASLFLSFLPMLPSQILLNNLLYDSSQLAIPTDHVDPEQLARPSRWDVGFIRRFMLFFGPVSSVFDFVTFGVMLWIFHAGAPLFRTGWFVESLATQTLVIFAIRTRRIQPLPGLFFVALALMVAFYLALIEIGKRWFYRTAPAGPAIRHRHPGYRLLRRAARFTTADSLPDRSRAADAEHGTG